MEGQLKQLGFRNFIHLNPMFRDKKKRMVWSGVYNGRLISIRVIHLDKEQSWILENIACDFMDDKLNDLLKRNHDINSTLDFIKSIQVI